MPKAAKSAHARQKRVKQHEYRPSAAKRGYDQTWRKLRTQVLIRDDYSCKRCGEPDPGSRPMHVDHIQPFNGPDDPLRLDPENLQTLCHSCHSQKTVLEDGLKRDR